MAQAARSLQLTDSYRDRMVRLVEMAQRNAHVRFPSIGELDDTLWVAQTTRAVKATQTAALRLTSGYLSSFLSMETGRRTEVPLIDRGRYVGLSRDGRPLEKALESPLVGVRVALKDGKTPAEALAVGLTRALRMVELDTQHVARTALLEAIDSDDRFDGWQRAVRGTCGACAGAARGPEGGLRFHVHPGCQCVSEPIVSGVRDRFPRPTGQDIFAAKTESEQDEMLGPDAAALVRAGEATLADLVAESKLDSDAENFITQKPIPALGV